MMTEADEADLLSLGQDLASAMNSPFEPRCIARAFASRSKSRCVLTMQVWIDLHDARSPVLSGSAPESLEDLESALSAFGFAGTLNLTPAEAADLANEMVAAVVDAFAMSLTMQPPTQAEAAVQDGFGAWLPLMSCLMAQCRLSYESALAMPVGRAFALIAALRRNQGWSVAGVPYALRDVSNSEPELSNP